MIPFLLLVFFHVSSSLEWERFSVPRWVVAGKDVELTCEFDVGGDRLYSVKWYKSGREFYRYVPGEGPPQQAFNQPGVTVDVKQSDEQRVFLTSVKEQSSGRYKCEVLTEAPLFTTLVRSRQMDVLELPKTKPAVEGGRQGYQIGEVLYMNCSGPRSRHPANLTWFINDQKAPAEFLVEYPSLPDTQGCVVPQLGLRFKVMRWHFRKGIITVRCLAQLLYYIEEVVHSAVAIRAVEENVTHQEQTSALAPSPHIGFQSLSLISILLQALARLVCI